MTSFEHCQTTTTDPDHEAIAMVKTVSQRVNVEEFIAWYPENSEQRYELHEGVKEITFKSYSHL